MEECIFCKIVKGEIPCYKVYDDNSFIGFLDITPRNPGHVLVIPKEHYRWVWDVPDLGGYYTACGKVANALRKVFETEWVVSLVAGEEVPHAHIWLVPRMEGDGHGGFLDISKVKEISKEEMEEIAEKIKNEIKWD